MELAPGQLINERYRVERVLGAGGMGQVLAAVDLQSGGRPVALKLLPAELADDADLLTRFRREAELAARVDAGGGIARVFDFSRTAGKPFCVLELCPGGDLDEAFKAGAVDRARLLEVVEALARTLARCHAAGVIHRDIKPQNVLFDEQGRPKLCDFGLALDLGVEERLTLSQEVMGTPAYMAPEQADAIKSAGPPADVYALGVILYRGVCGRPPFVGSPTQVLLALLNEAPPPPSELASDVGGDLEALILRAMAPEPTERPSAAELAEQIAKLRAGESLGGGATRRTRLRLGALAVALLLLALAGAGGALALRSRARARATWQELGALSPAALIGLAPVASDLAARLGQAGQAPDEALAERRRLFELARAGSEVELDPSASDLAGLLAGLRRVEAAERAELPRAAEEAAGEALDLLRRCSPRYEATSRALGLRALRARLLARTRRLLEEEPLEPQRVSQELAQASRSRWLEPSAAELASWAPAKEALLAAAEPRWEEPPTRLGATPPALERWVRILRAAPAVSAPPSLLESYRATAAAWVRAAAERPVERLESLAFVLDAGPDLDPAYRDPPGVAPILAEVFQQQMANSSSDGRLGETSFLLYLRVQPPLQVLRGAAFKITKQQTVLRRAPELRPERLSELRAARPTSRALAFWELLRGEDVRDAELARQAVSAARDDLHPTLRAYACLWRERALVPVHEFDISGAPRRKRGLYRERWWPKVRASPQREAALAALRQGIELPQPDLNVFTQLCLDEACLVGPGPEALRALMERRLAEALRRWKELPLQQASYQRDAVRRLADFYSAVAMVMGSDHAAVLRWASERGLKIPGELALPSDKNPYEHRDPTLSKLHRDRIRAYRELGQLERSLEVIADVPQHLWLDESAVWLEYQRIATLLALGRRGEAEAARKAGLERWADAKHVFRDLPF